MDKDVLFYLSTFFLAAVSVAIFLILKINF